ncbi:hypothetical protein [Pseudorhodobacter sp.]|nr:hypothetical protein [Pseudorhodobacter sp.]
MKPLVLLLATLSTSACDFTALDGAEPVVTGLGRTETSVTPFRK